MGYFNYFIKCIIRNISYKLCKPKVFLTVLLSIVIFFGLKHFGYCAWTDGEIEACLDGLSTITNNQGVIISQLSSMGVNVSDIENKLNSVNNELANISAYTNLTNSHLMDLVAKVENINTTLTTLCQQQNIYFENMNEQIRTIRDALVGSDDTPVTLEYVNIVNGTSPSGYTPGLRKYKIPMLKNYTYIIKVTYKNNESYDITVGYILSSLNISNDGVISDSSLNYLGVVPANSSSTFTITAKDDTRPYLYLTYGYNDITISATGSIEGLIDVLDRTNNQVVENIQQGNQLQEQQNQLQQDQNNFLKQETTDNDVSVDSFNSVDSNDITSSGLTGIFTTVYNSINTWSSKDIVLPVPFTNKSLTIPANYTHNMLSSVGGGSLIAIISTVYYFIVARFIIYSVTGIINSIKSGSILETDTKTNITTEML